MPSDLPVIGAAMPIGRIAEYREWLFAKDRDIEVQNFISADVLNGDWQTLASETRSLLDGHKGRIGIHGPFWGLTLDANDPEVRAIVTKRMHQGLAVCRAIGATQMVMHSPFMAWTHQNAPVMPGFIDGLTDRVHQTLRTVVAEAENDGVELVIENIEDVDPAARLTLAKSFGSDAVKVSIDTGHATLARHLSGAPPVDVYVLSASDRLAHVHLQDVDGYADRHWSLGEGVIAWDSFFRALASIPAEPRLILELRDHGNIPRSMAFLEQNGLGQ